MKNTLFSLNLLISFFVAFTPNLHNDVSAVNILLYCRLPLVLLACIPFEALLSTNKKMSCTATGASTNQFTSYEIKGNNGNTIKLKRITETWNTNGVYYNITDVWIVASRKGPRTCAAFSVPHLISAAYHSPAAAESITRMGDSTIASNITVLRQFRGFDRYFKLGLTIITVIIR